MSSDIDRLLSEFIDAWNAGRRPDVEAHLARAAPADRAALAGEIERWLAWAPEPAYDAAALAAIREAPAVREALGAPDSRAGLWPALLPRLRARARLSRAELGDRLARALGVASGGAKTAAYLGSLEDGRLDPGAVSQRVLDQLGRILGVPPAELDAAGGPGAWTPAAVPAWRAEPEAAAAAQADLELLADALTAPASEPWDEIDELFRGGR